MCARLCVQVSLCLSYMVTDCPCQDQRTQVAEALNAVADKQRQVEEKLKQWKDMEVRSIVYDRAAVCFVMRFVCSDIMISK